MALVNEHFLKLPGSYLFSDIAKRVNTFKITHPKQDIIRLGIGDVTRPLAPACIEAMHKAVEEMAHAETFRPTCRGLRSSPRFSGFRRLSIIDLDNGTTLPTRRCLSTTVPKAIRETSETSSVTTTA